jgi:O-methyltransferase
MIINKFFFFISRFLNNKKFYLQSQMDIHKNSLDFNDEFITETGGFFPLNSKIERQILNLEPWDNIRRDLIILILKNLIEKNISGEIVEAGVFKGKSAKLIHKYAPNVKLHLFDTFSGFDQKDLDYEKKKFKSSILDDFKNTNLDLVKNYIDCNENVYFYPGYLPKSIPNDFEKKIFSFVHIDLDLYAPIYETLNFFYNKMSTGGIILIHDYNSWIGARKAVDDFCLEKKIYPIQIPDKSGSAIIQC